MKECPAAAEIFDLAVALFHLFGYGDGQILLRGVGTLFGEGSHVIRKPGGTRKIGHLAGVPGNLLVNYKHYIVGLHCRIAWRKSGHGKQSLQFLHGIGRRLSDLKFVAFLLCFKSIFNDVVRPYALRSQLAAEPWRNRDAESEMELTLRNVKALYAENILSSGCIQRFPNTFQE